MLTTMDGSPTGCSINAALTSCSSPTAADSSSMTTELCREVLASPPRQDTFCAKRPSSRTKHSIRHQPYPDGSAKSPGSCSSDGGDSAQSDGDSTNADGSVRVHGKVKRVAANSRERKRMHTVNSAFDQLRELVPTYPSNRKLSKIDTLRLACTYIQDLVSLLHNTQGIQGEDVLYHQPFPDTFNGYPAAVKQEISEFAPFTPSPDHFRMQPAAACLRFPGHPDGCPESYASSTSESDSTTHSPPHPFMQQGGGPQQAPPPLASLGSRPPPLTRVSSEASASIHTRMAEASISSGQVSPIMALPPPPPSTFQRQVSITSPLAMHAVHHNSTQNLLHSSLEHHSPPPVWQRPSPIPTGFALYGQ